MRNVFKAAIVLRANIQICCYIPKKYVTFLTITSNGFPLKHLNVVLLNKKKLT